MNIKLILFVTLLALLACSTTMETFPPARIYTADITPTETASQDREPDSGAVYWPTSTETASPLRCAVVTAQQALHLRAAPSEKSPVRAYLYHDDQLELIQKGSAWWELTTGQVTGWSKAEYLKEAECQ